MAESADASDLKSDDGDIVWVRPPLALLKNPGELFPGFLFFFRISASCSAYSGRTLAGLFFCGFRVRPDPLFPADPSR